MHHSLLRVISFGLCAWCMTNMLPLDRSFAQRQSEDRPASTLDGIWSGSWGGGGSDGVVFQPVIAELYINGEHAELTGFPGIERLSGTVLHEENATHLQFIPANEEEGVGLNSLLHRFSFSIESDRLTLIDEDRRTLTLERVGVVEPPLANASIELVTSDGISDDGSLILLEYRELEIGRDKLTAYAANRRIISLEGAAVLQVKDEGCVALEIDEAAQLIDSARPVAVIQTTHDLRSRRLDSSLWRTTGTSANQNLAIHQTLIKSLRPDTLVFVVRSEIAPPP